MKLHLINDAAADEQQKIIKELNKLAKDAELVAMEELDGLLEDPIGMVRHTLKGIKSEMTLLDDETWWHEMFSYWGHLDPKVLMAIYEKVFEDAMNKVREAVDAGVMVEGMGMNFLSILASFIGMFIVLAFGGYGGRGGGGRLDRDGRRRDGRRRDRRDERRRDERYRDERYRDDLPPTPRTVGRTADDTFELRRLNPVIVYDFVAGCVKATKDLQAAGELTPFDEPETPGDLGDETPFDSGEVVDYPLEPEAGVDRGDEPDWNAM